MPQIAPAQTVAHSHAQLLHCLICNFLQQLLLLPAPAQMAACDW
jgi:hypothetical protein